jgi:hypothetical protein
MPPLHELLFERSMSSNSFFRKSAVPMHCESIHGIRKPRPKLVAYLPAPLVVRLGWGAAKERIAEATAAARKLPHHKLYLAARQAFAEQQLHNSGGSSNTAIDIDEPGTAAASSAIVAAEFAARNNANNNNITNHELSSVDGSYHDSDARVTDAARAAATARNYYRSEILELDETAKCTISMAFSPDGKTLASTHGDHSVKITDYHSGKVLRNLIGHPRTPWTVKYHPTGKLFFSLSLLLSLSGIKLEN